jgi:hypothetical protein
MKIFPVELVKSNESTKIQTNIEYAGKQDVLWYSVPNKYSQYLTTEKLDGFVVSLLLLGMNLGEDIEVKGPMSEKLYYNLTRYYMKIVQNVIPSLKIINIIPDSLHDGKSYSTQGAVGSGFSAGVDSLTTIHDNFLSDVPPHFKITHFCFHNVGAHVGLNSVNVSELFNTRYAKTKILTDKLGVDLIKIDTNLSNILNMDFRQTHTPRNLSNPLLLQKLFSKFYYSNVFRYQDSMVRQSKNMASADFAAVHLLSTETIDMISYGCQYSRVQKTKIIAGHEMSQWLSPCVSPDPKTGKNCSHCWKCGVTMFSLELHGLLDNFGNTFDLNLWKKRSRNIFIFTTVLRDHSDPLFEELREYAKATGYKFTLTQRLLSKLYSVYKSLPNPMRKMVTSSYNLVKRTS